MINTEQQIAAAKQQMEEDLEADAELLGLRRKKKPATATAADAAGGSEGTAATSAAEGAECSTAAASGDGDAAMTDAEQHDELVSPA